MFRIIIILIFSLHLNQCGYDRIYSSQNINFKISEILIEGDIKIGRQIKRRLNSFMNVDEALKSFKIKLNSDYTKNISSKDKQGNPKTFSLNVNVKLTHVNDNNVEVDMIFAENINYNNNDDKFNLRRYEDSLKENLTEKIIENILIYLQSLPVNIKSNASLTGNIGFTNKSETNDN